MATTCDSSLISLNPDFSKPLAQIQCRENNELLALSGGARRLAE
jgi:hypothetical protein